MTEFIPFAAAVLVIVAYRWRAGLPIIPEFTQQSIFLALAGGGVAFLAWLYDRSRDENGVATLPVFSSTGQRMLPITIYLVLVVLGLFAIGGVRLNIFKRLEQENLLGFAILAGLILHGFAVVLAGRP